MESKAKKTVKYTKVKSKTVNIAKTKNKTPKENHTSQLPFIENKPAAVAVPEGTQGAHQPQEHYLLNPYPCLSTQATYLQLPEPRDSLQKCPKTLPTTTRLQLQETLTSLP